MATLTDATEVTSELLELTRELRRQVERADADFNALAYVADGVAELADMLATTFAEVDQVLVQAAFIHSARDSRAEPAVPPPEAQPAAAEAAASPAQRRAWLTTLLRPARWLGRRLRDVRQIFRSRTPSERPEFA